jgi:RHS repeat-associated protein
MLDIREKTGDSNREAAGQTEHRSSISPAAPPTISLPKGGGAIRGIGEKFTANSVNGTGSMSVPILTSPGRSGFGPQLSLSYDSGSGNGPFGMGWNLALPSITRKTDKGLPKYRDEEESDVFVLSGAEDLVPVFEKNPDGSWVRDHQGNFVADEKPRDGYMVKRYQPRIEGLFARIERWTRISDSDTHWRSISRDNVLTVYGSSLESRIADPQKPGHIFSWLICESYDDKGNAVVYEYVAENDANLDRSHVSERNREHSANRYLKYIRYGNRKPLLIDPALPSFRKVHVPTPDFSNANWMFEVVFDYGEGHYQEMPPDSDDRSFVTSTLKPPANGKWPARLDPFSTYRSCFEVRSHRLCRRVLMFHHFPAEFGAADYMVRSTEFTYHEKPNGSFMSHLVPSGFKRIASPEPRYLKRSLPPLEFGYSVSPLDDLTYDQLPLQEVDAESLENLPSGIDNNNYRWVDLDGEGISGVLSEQAGGWFYKRNLGEGHFKAVESVSPQPSLASLNRGRAQLLDLAGDGHLDLVEFGSSTSGFFSRTSENGWDQFRSFTNLPNVDWQDPNLRFVDLTGDGHADLLVTEDQAFSTWHESYAEEGFAAATHIIHPLDEQDGPRLVFADGTQSIYLADMSGDGLSDMVRIRRSEVCYWPNSGYGNFGKKITMDHAPWFDDAESFDQHLIHLTDTDGSGPTDIVYLGRDGVRIYLNQHGNSLSEPRLLSRVPPTNDSTSVSVVDFLGRGTACLLWSSSLASDTRRSLRYLDLMGGKKPHLLTSMRNNLGAETLIEYASSTHFYLEDKKAGTPWVTRLPFPVHVVTRVETKDLISGNRFVTSYTYHHGYFDGVEREFRGFARVDQLDTEEFGVLVQTGGTSTNLEAAFYVPPALTKTWFHTGAYFEGARISRYLEAEYYREREFSPVQPEAMLLDDTVLPSDLSTDERREATRSLKGAILRQEVYAVDEKEESDRPYSVSERNYTIQPVQPRGSNRHSVFFTHEREAISFHYERKLFLILNRQVVDEATGAADPNVRWQADPRVSHAVTLDVDQYGNVRRSVAIAYGRRFDDPDPVLTDADRKNQKQLHVTITEASFTNVVRNSDAYRTPLPAEIQTYELLKFRPAAQQPDITNLFRFTELVSLAAQAGDGAHDLLYEDINATAATEAVPYRRRIEHVRTRYRSNNLDQLLPLQKLEALALPGESYQLAFTPGLLNAVYQRPHDGKATENLLPDARAVLIADATQESDRGGYIDLDTDGHWWIPSGRVFFHPDESAATDELKEAAQHFFLPRRFLNQFGHSSFVDYANDLFAAKSRDALGNTVVAVHDYRVLQAMQVTDANGNRSFAVFDALGLPVAMAVCGKVSETLGDSLDDFRDFDADPTLKQLQEFVARPGDFKSALLKSATSRFVYDLERYRRCGAPPFAATLVRETHVSDASPSAATQIQVNFAYSDGFGREAQSKIQAEPGEAPVRAANRVLPSGDVMPGSLTVSNGVTMLGAATPRWVGKGRTVYNNKGKRVKQYEPFFSSTHLYESEPEMTDTGVTPILFYDPAERLVATLHPNHSYEKVVFDPWRQENWDVNDTVGQSDPKNDPDVGKFFQLLPAVDYLPTWHGQRQNGQKGSDEKAAAIKASAHAATPTVVHFDALGRPMLTVADNGKDANGVAQKFATRVVMDVEGNQREVLDAKDRVVMRYDYDLLGNRIHQSSMEAGQRWILNDVSQKPIRSWDSRDHNGRIEYDELRRPSRSFVTGADALNPAREIRFEEIVYGESASSKLNATQILQGNLRGKTYKHYDSAGVATNEVYDFKGNTRRSTRQLLQDYKTTPDWSQDPQPVLELEIFTTSIRYDALNRPIQVIAPHGNQANSKINFIQPGYNEANLLERLDSWLGQSAEPSALIDPQSASLHAVINIDYDAKGQRTRIEYGNGVLTEYKHDNETFRLIQLKTSRAGSQFQDLFYTYDPAGNITHTRDDAQQTIYFNGQVVQPQCDYVYDPIYRLIKTTGREHIGQLAQPETNWNDEFRVNFLHPNDGAAMRSYTEQYFYDAVGNFEKLVHQAVNGNWTRSYVYNEPGPIDSAKRSNRLSSTTVGSTTEPYVHDAHGNMTSMPHLTLMQWDFRDQLTATSRQAVNETPPPDRVPEMTFYVYGAGGQRVRKVTERQNGLRKEERLYLGSFELYREFKANGVDVALERETVHVMDDKQRIALVETRTQGNDGSPAQLVRYQFNNHLSSASLELDDKAKIISYEEYFPYGATSYQAVDQSIKAAAKRYRYTGKERDEETGFTYHGARYYAPWLGRWVSGDPAGLSDGANLYAYVTQNPLRFSDPSGFGGEEQGLGASMEKASQKHQDTANTLRGSKGLDPIDVKRQQGVGGARATIPDEVKTTPKGNRTVVDTKGRHVDSKSWASTSNRTADIKAGLDQVKNQLVELEKAGEIDSTTKGKVLRVLHDSDKGKSSTQQVEKWRNEAKDVRKQWVDAAQDPAEKALRERVDVVTTTRDKYAATTKAMGESLAKPAPAPKPAAQPPAAPAPKVAATPPPTAVAPKVTPATPPAPTVAAEPPPAVKPVVEPTPPAGTTATSTRGSSAATKGVGTGLFVVGMGTSVSNENDLGEFAMYAIAAHVFGGPTVVFFAVFLHTDDRAYNESGGQLQQYK